MEVVKLLLKRGADPNIQDNLEGYYPLHIAAEYKHNAVVEYLLTHGAQADSTNEFGITPLMAVMSHVWHRDASIPALLVKHGADILKKTESGCRAICFASVAGNHYAVKFLLDQGMDPNWKNGHGITPLYYAVAYNRRKTVLALLKGGADPKLEVDRVSPLDLARKRRNKKLIQTLSNWVRNHKRDTQKVSQK